MKKKYAGFLSTFAMAVGLLALSASAEGLDTQIPGAGMAVVLNQYYAETEDPQTEITAMLEQVSDMEIASEAEDRDAETASEEDITESEETEEETDPLMAYYDTIVISQVTDDSYVNVRTEPNTESEIVGKLYDNCAATIVSEEDGWYKIQSGTVEGYVKATYFVTGEDAKELALELGEVVATVTANILNVRADQGTDETWLTILEYGTEVEVLEYGDNWVKVSVDDDLVGWVSADYIDIRVDFDTAISLEEEELQLAEEAERLQAYEDAMAKLAQSEETTTEEQTTTEEKTTTKAAETTTTAAETTTTKASNSDGVTFTSTNDTIYATANVYIRVSYSTTSSKIAKVTSGTALKRTGIGSNGWDRVSYNGGTYYVYAKYFTTTEPTTTTTQTTTKSEETTTTTTTTSSGLDDLRAAVVAYALQFVGNPYVYGGTSLTNGTDCSGFTMSVYAHFGISICHSSKGQVNYGIAVTVSESSLLPGDLLFYSNDGSTIGHVALYIGNGQVVHASSAKTGIKISTWNYRTPVAARRLIY